MRNVCCGFWLGAALMNGGCQPELPAHGEPSSDAGSPVLFEPARPELGNPVFRIRLERGVSVPFPRLFSDALSDYHQARAAALELPGTLKERLVPLFDRVEGGVRFAAPLDLLSPGQYELLLAQNERIKFEVAEPQGTWLKRVWPADAVSGGSAVYCVASARSPAPSLADLRLGERTLELFPKGEAQLTPISGECLALTVRRAAQQGSMTPLAVDGWPLQPSVFVDPKAQSSSGNETECPNGFAPLALGCAQLLDDRLIVQGPEFDTYWIFQGAITEGRPLSANQKAVFVGLEPARRQTISVLVLDESGRQTRAAPWLTTGQPSVHVVINEVMANPLGPEPAQEWVELVNGGSQAVDLHGFSLGDASYVADLPSWVIGAGEFALVVPEAFDESAGWDVVPEANTPVLRVSRLGQSGLSNSGEPLRLISPSGTVISRFSARPEPGAGISVARRSPSSPDDADESFGLHDAPGASPGRANILR